MFSIELELLSVVANPKGGNRTLSIRIRGRYIFNVFLTSTENRYVFDPFCQYHNCIDGFNDREDRFRSSACAFAQAFRLGVSARVLSFVFDGLYVLRNQLVHGGSTWNSAANRTQVRDGAAILGFLLPVFIDLMMDNSREDWGRPFYPVVEG